jgi:hypothetical protein
METNKVPTAEEFLMSKVETRSKWVTDIMVEFAKLHVKAALETAAENSMIVLKSGYGRMNEPDNESTITKKMKTFSDEQRGFGECTYNTTFVDKDSILNAYPETLIK